jgi:hypothetical protein
VKAGIRGVMVTLALLVGTATAGIAVVSAAEEAKVVKPTSYHADVEGRIQGLGAGKHALQVQLYRVEANGLTLQATATAKANGDFFFATLEPGQYVVTPVLESLPPGVGLYARHQLVTAHRETVAVEFEAGQIDRLELNAPEEVLENEQFFVEAHAFDREGRYLFAASEVTLPEQAVELAQAANGRGLALKGPGNQVTIVAANGRVRANAIVKVRH